MEECGVQEIHPLADKGTDDSSTGSGRSRGTLIAPLVSYPNHISNLGENLGADIGSWEMPRGIPRGGKRGTGAHGVIWYGPQATGKRSPQGYRVAAGQGISRGLTTPRAGAYGPPMSP